MLVLEFAGNDNKIWKLLQFLTESKSNVGVSPSVIQYFKQHRLY